MYEVREWAKIYISGVTMSEKTKKVGNILWLKYMIIVVISIYVQFCKKTHLIFSTLNREGGEERCIKLIYLE